MLPFDLIIRQKTARDLGLTLSPSPLMCVNEVIE